MLIIRYFGLFAIIAVLLLPSNVSAQKPVIEWQKIPAGTFTMGSPANEPDRNNIETPHQVTLSGFKISKYEVTISQFKAFVDATGYVTDAENGAGGKVGSIVWTGTALDFKNGANWKCNEKGNLRRAAEYNCPVVHVSWNDAEAFAEWMGCRLPTEAEWEYVCRAGTTTIFNQGNNLTTSQANYDGNFPYNNNSKGEFREKVMPVGSFAPNKWNLFDMHGNVCEWCSDWYGDYPTKAQVNPQGPATGKRRISRGGGWMYNAQRLRSADRGSDYSANRTCYRGFRLACSE
jgi:formylglycine-generating enzyme